MNDPVLARLTAGGAAPHSAQHDRPRAEIERTEVSDRPTPLKGPMQHRHLRRATRRSTQSPASPSMLRPSTSNELSPEQVHKLDFVFTDTPEERAAAEREAATGG